MAKVTEDEVKKLAKLSAISLTDDDIKEFQKQIAEILQYVEQLQDIDTEGVKPTTQVTNLKNVMRKDEIAKQQISSKELLKNVPEMEGDLIKVPKIL